MEVKLDKALYREAQKHYQQFNEDKLRYRAQQARTVTPVEAWQRYQSLFAFGHKLSPQPNEWEQRRKAKELILHYEYLKKLETWRLSHGKTQRA